MKPTKNNIKTTVASKIFICFLLASCGLPSDPKLYPPDSIDTTQIGYTSFINRPNQISSLTSSQVHADSFKGYEIYYRIVFKDSSFSINGNKMYDYVSNTNSTEINRSLKSSLSFNDIKIGTGGGSAIKQSTYNLRKLYVIESLSPLTINTKNSIWFETSAESFDSSLEIKLDFSQIDKAPYLPKIEYNGKSYYLGRYFKLSQGNIEVVDNFNPLDGSFYKKDPDVVDSSSKLEGPIDAKIVFFIVTKGFDLLSGSGILYSDLSYFGFKEINITFNNDDERKF
ncbi:MAG: hypothetical protein JXR63_10110 [Spirochaetales bacterium]|nr:hypothetical protein [Spirochaetales bacterium]